MTLLNSQGLPQILPSIYLVLFRPPHSYAVRTGMRGKVPVIAVHCATALALPKS